MANITATYIKTGIFDDIQDHCNSDNEILVKGDMSQESLMMYAVAEVTDSILIDLSGNSKPGYPWGQGNAIRKEIEATLYKCDRSDLITNHWEESGYSEDEERSVYVRISW
jgi:hypothetical protein